MISKTFVGRGSELGRIREWLQKSTGGLVLITGVGGIGKTSLLRKIAEEYSLNDGYIVDYFDLAEQPMTMINQTIHLVDSLGREHFPDSMRKLTELDTISGKVVIGGLEENAVNACMKETATHLESMRKKLLRITDTFEIALRYSLYKDDWAGGINEKLKDIPGSVFIVAGRDKLGDEDILEKIYPALTNSFGKENVLHLPLSGFNEVEAGDFFKECDPHRMIPQEMRDKMQMLTDGRPILLSLAVEWLQKDIPLPIMLEKNLQELREISRSQNEWKALLNAFEFELVSRVRQLRNPLDIALLYMAHIDRRMDSNLLSILLDIKNNEAENYLQALLQLPFVKEYIGSIPKKCTLHDEMCKLVKQHAWKYLDISGVERNHLTRKVIEQYYIPLIGGLKQKRQYLLSESRATLLQSAQARVEDQERWMLEAEALYYSSKLGEMDAFMFFDQAFYDSEDSYIRDQFLLDELRRAGLNSNKVALREADGLRRRGQVDEAMQTCLTVIQRDDLDISEKVHAYTALGNMSENNSAIAEENFRKALELAVSIHDFRVQAILHNNLGRLYMNMNRLEESIGHFNKATELFRQTQNRDSIYTVRKNLAWTYRMSGDLDAADTLCSLSIAEHRKRGQERPLAYDYLTKSDIDQDKGNFQSAEKYARMALAMFDRLDDIEGKSKSYRVLANVSRHLLQFEQAMRYLRTAILLVENRKPYPLLASLYQLYGRTYRHYATYLKEEDKNAGSDQSSEISHLYSEALQALQVSIDLAQKIGNRWEVARSQIEIVLIMMLNEGPLDESEIHNLLGQVWQAAEEMDELILKGYVYENRARLDMRHDRYLDAGRAFGEAAYLFAKRTGMEAERSFRRLNEVLLDPNLLDSQAKALSQGVNECIQHEGYEGFSKLVALKNMCQHILGEQDVEGDF